MIQSIVIFVVILVLKAVLTAVAKSKEDARKAASRGAPLQPGRPSPTQVAQSPAAPRALPSAFESQSNADLQSDARRRGHIHQRAPVKSAPMHESEGESTYDQLAQTVAAIHRGMLTRNASEPLVPITVPPPAVKAVESSNSKARRAVALKNRATLRQAMIMREVLSPPLSLRVV